MGFKAWHLGIAALALVALAAAAFMGAGAGPEAEGADAGTTPALPTASPAGAAPAAEAAGASVTVVKFHGNSQCASCMNLGAFANATINREFASEAASGKVRFIDINAEAEPDDPLVVKYKPTHASLYMIVERDGNESFSELAQAWYYTGDEAAFGAYLSGAIRAELE